MTAPAPSAAAGPSEPPCAVELRHIVKRFPGVVANDGVHLRVRPATVHAIVGENGAGKSTLMKTLYGAHQPDGGDILIGGEPLVCRSPADAIAAGIGMVFQHFMLADNLTVWENVVLGQEPGWFGSLGRRAARRQIAEIGERYGLYVNPDAYVSDLGVGDKQRVEIIKVLYRGARIVILDEPTAVLVPQEVERLFGSLRDLTAAGTTVIFISHKLDEVLAHADSVTVIRAGRTVGEIADPSAVTSHQLAEMMVGSELPSPGARDDTVRDEARLELRNVRVEANAGTGSKLLSDQMAPTGDGATGDRRWAVDDVSLTISAGEIVGVAGVEGNGQSELVDAIMGLRAADGEIIVDGTVDLAGLSTMRRRRLGIGHIPEDRQRDGIVLDMPLWENVLLGHQGSAPFVRRGWIDADAVRHRTEQIISEYDVRTPSALVNGQALSGGNQQKLIVGREMSAQPRILVAAHPTRGVDVGAQAGIWEVLRTARAEGLATLLVSADLDELIGLSDRLVVMLRGRIVAELAPDDVTPTELGSHMTGAAQRGAA